ncbi:MAG: hypothetical protein ACREQW_21655 [Candidatus Binatia bacterium]
MQTIFDLHSVGYRRKVGKVSPLIQRQALDWFMSDRCRLGSFVWVCHHLGIDPAAVRRRVVNAQVVLNQSRPHGRPVVSLPASSNHPLQPLQTPSYSASFSAGFTKK